MTTIADQLLPSAKESMAKLAVAESEKAAQYMREQAAAEAEKQAFIDRMKQPSGVSDEEGIRRGAAIIQRAINAGLTEVEVYRFSNALCTDHGRAINQQEAGWENTLTGLPKEMYEFWNRQLRPRGYKIKFQIVDWPGGGRIDGGSGNGLMSGSGVGTTGAAGGGSSVFCASAAWQLAVTTMTIATARNSARMGASALHCI